MEIKRGCPAGNTTCFFLSDGNCIVINPELKWSVCEGSLIAGASDIKCKGKISCGSYKIGVGVMKDVNDILDANVRLKEDNDHLKKEYEFLKNEVITLHSEMAKQKLWCGRSLYINDKEMIVDLIQFEKGEQCAIVKLFAAKEYKRKMARVYFSSNYYSIDQIEDIIKHHAYKIVPVEEEDAK